MVNLNSLKKFNTFNLDIKFDFIYIVDSISDLKKILFLNFKKKRYSIFLGYGSNTLFLNDFYGTLIINRIKGIKIKENIDFWFLNVYSGESWSNFVNFTIYNGIYGLENLSFIPGSVGGAVVNNIGAYGLELQKFFYYAKILDCYTGKVFFLKKKNFFFSYRYSVFKNFINNRYIILKVGFLIKKIWKPCLLHKNLLLFFDPLNNNINVEDIYKKILEFREKKIPNPKIFGNIGSIFKNPIIDIFHYKYIKKIYFPYFSYFNYFDSFLIKNKIKIPAALLIDICGLKGYTIGWAKVYEKQPLIIINLGYASPKHIYSLSLYVRKKVFKKFNIFLEFEIKIIDFFYLLKNDNFFKV